MLNWNDYLQLLAGLISVVNPIGAIPTFMALTDCRSDKDKTRIAIICAISVCMVLHIALFGGEPILTFFSISLAAFRVAGGILLLLMGISMLHVLPDRSRHTPEEAEESYTKESIGVVPLAIPLLSGPGAISTTIVFGHLQNTWSHFMTVSAVIFTVSVIVLVAMLIAPKIARVMGSTGMNVMTRVMGLLLTAIAVEFMTKGLTVLFPVLNSSL